MKRKTKKQPSNGLFLIGRFKGRSLKIHAARIPGEYFSMSRTDLEKSAKPTECLRLLKKRFWDLNINYKPGNKYSVHDLHEGICTYQYLYQGVIKSPEKLCWLLRDDILPSRVFAEVENELMNRLAEIVRLPILKDGRPILQNVRSLREIVDLILRLREEV